MLKARNYNTVLFTTYKVNDSQVQANRNLWAKLRNDKESKGFWKYFQSLIDAFLESSSLHGLDKITSKSNRIKRFLWFCILISSLLFFTYIGYTFAMLRQNKPMSTFPANTQYPIYQIAFPEVTICNKNRFNWQRFEVAKEKFLKSLHHTKEYEEIFMATVKAYDTLEFGAFNKFENLTEIPLQNLENLNYVNFSLVAEFMAWKCHEIFSDCLWLNQYYNCCEIFFPRRSQLGLCLAFNSIESTDGLMKQSLDPYWPWRTNGLGVNKGLRVKVNIRESLHSPNSKNVKGLVCMITEPTVWFNNFIEVPTHTKATVALTATLNYYDSSTRYFSSSERECVFEDELTSINYKSLQDHPYMYENCLAECEQEYLLKFCNCTMDLFYPPSSYKACQLSDLPCLYRHNDKVQYVEEPGESEYASNIGAETMKCHCYLNCRSLAYTAKVFNANMTNVELDVNNSYIDVSFFFRSDSIITYQTTLTYKWTDLMSGFGGLAVLCIGCSILNILELFYYFLIDVPMQIFHYIRNRKRSNITNKSYSIKRNLIRDILRK